MTLKELGLAGCALLALSSAACREIEPDANSQPPREALEGVPIVPMSLVLSEGGTGEASQTVLFTPFGVDSTAVWYRRRLIEEGWEIVSDVRDSNGRTTVYAVRDGPPLWVILQPYETQPGTRYTIIGVVPDTAQLAEARRRAVGD